MILWTLINDPKSEKQVSKAFKLKCPPPPPISEAEKMRIAIEITQDVTSIDWSPTGEYLAAAYHDFTVRIWGLDGTLIASLEDHAAPNFAAKWSPDGKYVASASLDSRSICYELCDSKTVKKVQIFEHHDGTFILVLVAAFQG